MMELYREWPSDSNYREEGSNDIGSHAGMLVLANPSRSCGSAD